MESLLNCLFLLPLTLHFKFFLSVMNYTISYSTSKSTHKKNLFGLQGNMTCTPPSNIVYPASMENQQVQIKKKDVKRLNQVAGAKGWYQQQTLIDKIVALLLTPCRRSSFTSSKLQATVQGKLHTYSEMQHQKVSSHGQSFWERRNLHSTMF